MFVVHRTVSLRDWWKPWKKWSVAAARQPCPISAYSAITDANKVVRHKEGLWDRGQVRHRPWGALWFLPRDFLLHLLEGSGWRCSPAVAQPKYLTEALCWLEMTSVLLPHLLPAVKGEPVPKHTWETRKCRHSPGLCWKGWVAAWAPPPPTTLISTSGLPSPALGVRRIKVFKQPPYGNWPSMLCIITPKHLCIYVLCILKSAGWEPM